MSTNNNDVADAAEKTAEEVKEVAADVAEVPPESVAEVADTPVSDDVNDKIDALAEKVDDIIEQLGALAAAPVAPEMPGDGEVITDETPLSKPWTHRNPFSKRQD